MTTIAGYASVFYSPRDAAGTEYELSPGVFERISPTAFDASRSGKAVLAAFNHDLSIPLGKNSIRAGTLRLQRDSKGLRYEIDLPNSPNGENVAEAIRRGDVTGSSFSFTVTRQSFEETKRNGKAALIRTIEELTLHELGPVTSPAYSAATVDLVKS